MKKIFKIIVSTFLVLSVASTVSLQSIKAIDSEEIERHLDIEETTPAYISDNFFWSHTSQVSTWSYNEEGSRIKFKVPRPTGKSGERIFTVDAYTYKAEKLKSYIKDITTNEYTVLITGGGAFISIMAAASSGGTLGIGTLVAGYKLQNAINNLNRLYPEAAKFAENNF